MPADHNPFGWIEIPVSDLERAKAFYESVFEFDELPVHEMGGLKMAWFPMKEDAIGAAGALCLGDTYEPSHAGTLPYLTTPDIEATLERAEANGGTTILPKMSIGEYGFVAFLEDSEGNRIGLHSRS
jgi:predicted enzyme related to lactoylglutathione lyase